MPGPDPVTLFADLVDAFTCGDFRKAGRCRDALRKAGWIVSPKPGGTGQGAELTGPEPGDTPQHGEPRPVAPRGRQTAFELAGASS